MVLQKTLVSGSQYSISATVTGSSITIQRPRANVFQAIPLAILSCLALGVLSIVMFCAIMMLSIGITEYSFLALVMAFTLIAGGIPAGLAFLGIQGLMFSFVVTIELDRLRYKLSNGFRILRLTFPEDDYVISFLPAYNRGAWGYAAGLRRGRRGWSWPVIPPVMLGAKSEALREAQRVMQFIGNEIGMAHVRLEKWGDDGLAE